MVSSVMRIMCEKKNGFHLNEKHVPWLLLIFTLAAYIPLAAQMGFYWDDWPMLWFKITKGAEGFATAFDSDRPFLGYLYQLTATFLSNHPLEWQIITVFLRWLITLAFWWTIKQLWPERKTEVFWISLLLAVYPGFKQMPIVYVWLNAFFMLLAYVLSFGMMLKAIGSKTKRGWILWTVPSVLLFTFCTISTEYYTGLEISRGLFIWIFLARESGFRDLSFWKKVWKVVLQWLPYIGVLGVFMFWRVFIFQFPSYQPVLLEQLAAKPAKTIFDLFVRIIEDAYTATWGAWTEFFSFPNHVDYETASGKLFWLVVLLSFAVVLAAGWFYRPGNQKTEKTDDQKKNTLTWCLTAMGLGAFMVICPGLPYWVTTLPVRLSYPYDRFLLAFMFGSSIFIVGLVSFFLRAPWQKIIVLSLFAAMAMGGHILNANSYRKDWNMQKDFAAQLVTRIPSLKPETILLTDNNPLTYESDNSLTGLVNLALKPDQDGDRLPYSLDMFTSRFGTVENFIDTGAIYQDFRGTLFAAPFDQVVVFHYAPPACLRIIDPEQHKGLNIFPDNYKSFMALSDPKDRIDPDAESQTFLFDEVFRKPIPQDWCYFFQKADLARQTENWEAIAEIGDEVLPKMRAREASEYFVFTEAYINLDRWDDAFAMFRRIHAEGKNLDPILCPYIHGWLENHPPSEDVNVLELIAAMNSVGCAMDRN